MGDVANEEALRRLSNGVLAKYPPERTYPDVDGKHDYVYRQAADDIKAATGAEIDPEEHLSHADPDAHGRRSVRQLTPCRAAIHCREGQRPAHAQDHGRRSSPTRRRPKFSAQRKAQLLKSERKSAARNPTIADVGLPTATRRPWPKYEPATD